MGTKNLTEHAQKRKQQRGFSDLQVELIRVFGEDYSAFPGNRHPVHLLSDGLRHGVTGRGAATAPASLMAPTWK